MPYVSRDESSSVNGLYANHQPDYAEEYLPDDDPEVVAFLNAPLPTSPAVEVLYDHENRLRVLEGQPPLTLSEFTAKARL